jgi:hypothetical protein
VASIVCLVSSRTDEPVRRGYLVTSHAQLDMPAAVFVRFRLALGWERKRETPSGIWVSGSFLRRSGCGFDCFAVSGNRYGGEICDRMAEMSEVESFTRYPTR